MAIKRDKDQVDGAKDYHGITIKMNGKVGKIKRWNPKPLDEKGTWPEKYTDFVSNFSRCGYKNPGGMHQISFPVGSIPMFLGSESSGKSTLGLSMLGKLLAPGHLYIRAQLEMWGVEKTGEICEDCLVELASTLQDMGYHVWFDEKSIIDEDLAAAHGVVVRDYKLSYVGRGEEDGNSKGLSMEEVTSEKFQPATLKILGKETAEEPAIEVQGGFVFTGRGKVVLKFQGDNRRYYLSHQQAQEFGERLIANAKVVEGQKDE